MGGVQLRELEKSYRTSGGVIKAVGGIDVSIAAGETVALLGPNGAGKSTTIDMMLGLTPPDRGSVTVELTGLHDIADQRTQKLSGGQTQRVRFALALVSNPELLVLDEPTVAMDVEARHSFWTTMREFADRNRTVVFATHYLEEADAYADRAVLMANGHVVADGPTTEIKAMVGSRTIRATLPHVDPAELSMLPGVSAAEGHGEAVTLRCSDSDAAIRALLARFPGTRDIEIRGAGLEEAFLQLTSGENGRAAAPDHLEEAIR
jgi:ABC-2 type transport system ATP-binding protein